MTRAVGFIAETYRGGRRHGSERQPRPHSYSMRMQRRAYGMGRAKPTYRAGATRLKLRQRLAARVRNVIQMVTQ